MAIANQLNTATTPISIPEGGTGQTTNTAAINALVSAASLTTATVATGDLVLIQDVSDSNNLKSVTTQSIANLAASGVTSVSGTTNRITSTGGTTPVIDISASYVGQSSITTLGTISSGVWGSSATVIGASSGGTGVANTGTITVGGNTAFSGAFTFTGTITGNTGVTFPTSGTLQTTTGASGTVNSGTANQIAYYATTTNAVSGLSTTARAAFSSNSTGVPTWIALTDGQLLIGSSAGSPAAATITAGSGITVTNASNAITIAATAGSVSGDAKFWLVAAGAGTSILASFNITSITDVGTGLLDVTIATDFSSANWSGFSAGAVVAAATKPNCFYIAKAAGTCSVANFNGSSAGDPTTYLLAGFGDQ